MSECHLVRFIHFVCVCVLFEVFKYFLTPLDVVYCFEFKTNTAFPLPIELMFPVSFSFHSLFLQLPSTPFPFVPCSCSAGQMGWEKANKPPTSRMLFIHNITRCNALTPSFMFYKLFINSLSPAARIYEAIASLYMFSVN